MTTTTQFTADFATWAIVNTADGYEVRKVPMGQIGGPEIIALHPNKDSADNGLKRVRIIADLPMPKWETRNSFEAMLRETITRVIHEVALPGPEADDPAARS